MDIFEYLPQLIVAYDGNDEFANLIHVKKANKDNNYFCPCCGGSVKPRALDSTKEQSHYYHVTGKCTKESQLHFFCKNWLFEKGSKFYIADNLFEVDSIEIEKTWNTQFGDYKPDITVYTTSGTIIYFEMFFSNRKTGDDYFCKWNALGNDVVEVNIKEYMFKTDEKVIPTFKYLYHDGVCYSKTYEKRDLYANTIARIKREFTRQKVFNYKARVEQLDWFWKSIQSNDTRESILEILSAMTYEDLLSCYEIIKRKQCVLYLKNDVINMINQKVLDEVRKTLDLPYDENIYFDLKHIRGRTYEAGIRLNIKTEHIIYNKLYSYCNHWCNNRWYDFDSLREFPKVVFSKNILNKNEIVISDKNKCELIDLYSNVYKIKENLLKHEEDLSSFEKNKYKIRMNNDLYTVLTVANDKSEVLFENVNISSLDINKLLDEINQKITENKNDEFLKSLLSSDNYKDLMQEIKTYKDFDINIDIGKAKKYIRLKMYIGIKCFYNEILNNTIDFNKKKNDCISIIHDFTEKYSTIIHVVNVVNNCKNNFWKSEISFNNHWGEIIIMVDQKHFIPKRYTTFERIYFDFDDILSLKVKDIIIQLEKAMHQVMKNMERCGHRVMEVRNEK